MEGPNIRHFPRIALEKPVELRGGETVILLDNARGNLSVGGLFVTTPAVPPSGEVYLRISSSRCFEWRGQVRHSRTDGSRGIGIEFADLGENTRRDLEQLIAELTGEGAPAA